MKLGCGLSNLCELHIAALDSYNGVRGLDDLSNALAGEAVFSVRLPRQSHSLRRPWTGHLEREGSVMQYCIKARKSFASKQCLIAALERSNVEG